MGFYVTKVFSKTHKNFTVLSNASCVFSHQEQFFVNTLIERTNRVNSQMTCIHCESNACYLIRWASYGLGNAIETSNGILISWERNMKSRCIAKLLDFVKENISCCTMARDERFSWNLNSDTDSLPDQIQATDFFCSENDNAHLPSSSCWEAAEKNYAVLVSLV